VYTCFVFRRYVGGRSDDDTTKVQVQRMMSEVATSPGFNLYDDMGRHFQAQISTSHFKGKDDR
jgi:hypothetical protein